MNIRLLPPVDARYQTIALSGGRSITAAPGATVDVMESDAISLASNSWIRVAPSGTTAQRPGNTLPVAGSATVLSTGMHYLDTSLGKLIVWDGQAWRDPATGNSV